MDPRGQLDFPRPGGPPSQKTEHRRCDACGREGLCVLLPRGRGVPPGPICLPCLGRALGEMKGGANW